MTPTPMGPVLHGLRETQHVVVGVVERGRGNADHVGFAPVAEYAIGCEVFEQCAATLASTDDPDRQLTAALLRIGRSYDLQRVGEVRLDELFEIARQAQRALA